MGDTFAIVTGGGTAGHVQPALAIAEAMAQAGRPASSVVFVGSKRGLEARLLTESGFRFVLLPGRGLQRRLSIANVAAVTGLTVAFVRSLWLVLRLRPGVVVSVGGYAGLPCALAAATLRTPLVLMNADAVPGSANQLVARFAKACAVAFPGTQLPGAVVTGTPVRSEIAGFQHDGSDRAAARRALKLDPRRQVIAFFGGSLGSLRINTAVRGLAKAWSQRPIAFYHVLGTRDWPALGPGACASARLMQYRSVEYEEQMTTLYSAADLAVCRAGATTVAELAVVGLPSILVPLPGAPGDHQAANARVLVGAGAAVMVPDAECTAERLGAEIDRLLSDPDKLSSMSSAASELGRSDAAHRVAQLAEEHAKRRRKP